ncbi:MAG TPA: 5'/3'-nucleotidase SurE [Candidatus Omnitrophota bacterium]|nr:5'/3'-nucleotidase SurE [Candidatus Omnitrophota bacterium]HQL41807.1 5'/3'-nucleotidase SurE [Candidatus Omnitrophota bacterium]
MRILLTNDDGIQAPGLSALFKELIQIGQVTVVAPDSQRSSVGHGITLGKPIGVKWMRTRQGVEGFGLTGTPADCVKFALKEVCKRKPDIVVSGINLGANDGCSVFYSGTVAAAREASLYGVCAVAFSLDTFVHPDFDYPTRFAARFIRDIFKKKLARGTFLNVNIPHAKEEKIRGIRFVSQSVVPFRTRFIRDRKTSAKQFWLSCENRSLEKSLDIDTYALAKRFITVTPIQNDLTDHKTLKALKKKACE